MTTDITLKRGSRWTLLVWIGAALLLLTPALAMRFTKEVVWTPFDFGVWGAILALACGTFELAVRASGSLAFRAAVAIVVAVSFLTVWINGAVGIIGDEDNPANLMFGCVLLVAAAGAYVGRFRAAGLSRALLAAAFVQAVVAIVAQLMGSREGFVISVVFAGAWLLAAWLFGRAARVEAG
ncbi:hypothetical protein [Caulobacter sp.]|uniref:hypothetical protein n=1 Tax=Caulobacter sp. TaxID=78 RepID=UPI001B27B376|nr:hypothetical protein [Caulobacter sp.]MBO9547767.1 hypothetical protein [Caulobacter sp.]